MDNTGTAPQDYRQIALPFCLVSLIFSGIWPVSLAIFFLAVQGVWHYNGTLNGVIDILFQVFPLPAQEVLILLCLVGSLLFINSLKGRSLSWKAGIPLCVLCCVFLAGAFMYDNPYGRGQHTPVSGMICFVAFMSLPLGVNRVIAEFGDSLFDEVRSFSKKIGFSGCILSLIPILIEVQDVIPPQIVFTYQLGFSAFALAGIVAVVIVIFGAMPVLGLRLFRLGLRLRQIPAAAAEPAQS